MQMTSMLLENDECIDKVWSEGCRPYIDMNPKIEELLGLQRTLNHESTPDGLKILRDCASPMVPGFDGDRAIGRDYHPRSEGK